MKKHFLYLRYVILHKWFVFLACRKCGVSFWRAIIHDWTKFLPCEWFAYVDKFYEKSHKNEPDDFRYWLIQGPIDAAFDHAWNHHQKSNKHHWQYWLLTNDSDEPKHKPMQMPVKYVKEMVADWWGAGRAITGKWDAYEWYKKNGNKMILQEKTREVTEVILSETNVYFSEVEASLAKRKQILGY
jgi:hypothetical protein